MPDKPAIPRPGREPRPQFSPDEPIAERSLRLFTVLATELAVLHERLDTVETLLSRQGQLTAEDIETYVPDAAAEARRREWREAFLQRLFADLQTEIDDAIAASQRHE